MQIETKTNSSIIERRFKRILEEKYNYGIKTLIQSAIDSVLLPHGKKWIDNTPEDIVSRIYFILDLLEKRSPNNSKLSQFRRSLNTLKFIYDDNNQWHRINKLNTNKIDSINIITKILVDSINYDIHQITAELEKKDLSTFKAFLNEFPKNKDFLYETFILDQTEKYVINNINNSKDGLSIENNVERRCNESGWTILHKGGDGDPIDMMLGIDLIISKMDQSGSMELVTIQIKKATINIEKIKDKYYYVINCIVNNKYDFSILDCIVYGNENGSIVTATNGKLYYYYTTDGVFKQGFGNPIPTIENNRTIYIPKEL